MTWIVFMGMAIVGLLAVVFLVPREPAVLRKGLIAGIVVVMVRLAISYRIVRTRIIRIFDGLDCFLVRILIVAHKERPQSRQVVEFLQSRLGDFGFEI